jgi:glycosyltransferase involved in cell wall biosynthesis
MRILLANEARAGGGGVETYLANLSTALQGRGHDVALLYANPPNETGPTMIGAPDSWSVAELGLGRALERVRSWRADVTFSHNMGRLDVDEALAAAGPVVKMMHGYFGTCVSGQKAHLFPASRACSRLCGPACLALYLPRRCGRIDPLEMISNYRWAARQRALFAKYRSLVVASGHLRAEYLAHGVPPDRVHGIPLFATTETPPPVTAASRVDIAFVGRLTALKGPAILIDAARIASRRLGRTLSVTFAGEGPERAALQALALDGLIDVTASGWLDVRARTGLLARTHLLAVPSVWPEPFGLVGLEAGALGVPAVAFDTGGISEWLTDDVNGRLVRPAGDPRALGDAIAAVLADPATLARLSAGALEVARRLDVEAHVSKIEAVLDTARAS